MITPADFITAPNLNAVSGLVHGFGLRDSIPPPDIRTVRQIHSTIVMDAALLEPGQGTEGDALISGQPGTVVGVKTADCVPILLVDPVKHTVAAIHAGWRGTAGNIVAETVAALCVRWETAPGDIRAAIGPSIGPCCYEVGADVAHRFESWVPEMLQAGTHVFLDLPAVNERQLRAAGVSDIWKSGECTFCMVPKFFSFRREREQAGRMLSFIGWQKNIGRTS